MKKKLNELLNTSADDAKGTISFETDIDLLKFCLSEALKRDGKKTLCRHIKSRIRQLEKEK